MQGVSDDSPAICRNFQRPDDKLLPGSGALDQAYLLAGSVDQCGEALANALVRLVQAESLPWMQAAVLKIRPHRPTRTVGNGVHGPGIEVGQMDRMELRFQG